MSKLDLLLKGIPFGKRHKSSKFSQPNSPQRLVPVNSNATAPITCQDALSKSPPGDNLPLHLAIQRHCDSLSESDRKAFQEASHAMTERNLLSKVQNYDELHKSRSMFRARAETVSKFLNLLQRFMTSLSIAIQANPNPSAIVVGAVQLALTSALEIATFFDRLAGMINRLNDYLDPLTEYAKAARQSEPLLQEVAGVYGDLLQFWTAARHVFVDEHGKQKRCVSLRTFLRVQWDPFEQVFGNIEQRFKHHLDVLNHGAHALQLNSTMEILNEDKCMSISKTYLLVDLQADCSKVKEREEFLTWISQVDFEKSHEDKYARRHPGTGNWLVQKKSFQNWLNHESSLLLWCYGKRKWKMPLLPGLLANVQDEAGVGKSVLLYATSQ